jgi:hypothetical protein
MIGRKARTLSNTLIAFDADSTQFEKLSDRVIAYLRENQIMALPTDRPFHVSVSYISNAQEEDDLIGLMEEAEGAGRFHSKTLVPLKGKNGSTYIALQVEASPKFFNFKRKVDDHTKSRGFARGFKTHISLAKFPSWQMRQGLMEELNKKFNPVFSINSDRVLLYDQSHKIYRSMEANLELADHLKAHNRMSYRSMETMMRKILDRNTKGFFKDNHWAPVHKIQNELSAEMIDMDLMRSKYFHNKDSTSSEPDGKEWVFEVYYGDEGGWTLRVVASFGPSPTSDPMSVYDLVYTLTWSKKIKKEASLSSKLRKIASSLKMG